MTGGFNDLLFTFREHLKVRNYSVRTITAYSQQLQSLFDYLSGVPIADIRRVTRDMLKAYQLKITESGCKRCGRYTAATISVKIRATKRFFEYLEETNRILINPAEYLREPPRGKRLPAVVLTGDEAKRILESPNLSTMTGIRDKTILEVLYSSGIRKEEINSVLLEEVDYHEGFIRINKGKGGKDRVVPIGKISCRYLESYIKAVRPSLIRDSYNSHLFLSVKRNRLSKNVVWKMVKQYAKRAGIKKKVSPPHLQTHLRHPDAQEQGQHKTHSGNARTRLIKLNTGLHLR